MLQLAAEGVIADRAHQRYLGTQPGRRHRLVGSLAAGDGDETLAQQGLAGAGKARRHGDQVHVDAADHDDPGHDGLLAAEG